MQISYDEGNVVLTEVRDFDLAQTLECGQCFHFKKLAEQEYAVCAFHRLLRIRQEKDSVILFDTAMQDYEMIWRGLRQDKGGAFTDGRYVKGSSGNHAGRTYFTAGIF